VAQLAALAAGERLALARHRRPRQVPGAELPAAAVAAAVAERIVRMSAEELGELGQRMREQ